MSLQLSISPEAERDLAAAIAWHDERQPGLGDDLIVCLEATFASITDQPHAYPVVHRTLRRALTRRFPYGVYFSVNDLCVVVHAVFHYRRDPSAWQGRAPQG